MITVNEKQDTRCQKTEEGEKHYYDEKPVGGCHWDRQGRCLQPAGRLMYKHRSSFPKGKFHIHWQVIRRVSQIFGITQYRILQHLYAMKF